jgi:hypothetical protein
MWLPLTGPRFWCTIKTLVTVSRASGPFRPTTALIASQVFSHRPTVAAEACSGSCCRDKSTTADCALMTHSAGANSIATNKNWIHIRCCRSTPFLRIWLTRRRLYVEFPVDALFEVTLFPKSKSSSAPLLQGRHPAESIISRRICGVYCLSCDTLRLVACRWRWRCKLVWRG